MKNTKSRLKKALPWIAIAAILTAVAIIVVIIVIANYNSRQNVYPFTYLTATENSAKMFANEKRFFPSEEYLTNSNYVLKLLIAGPRSKKLKSPFPDNLKVLSAAAEDGILTINLSSEYLNQSNSEMLASDYCIIATLSHMEAYDGFVLSIAGIPHPLHGPAVLTKQTFVSDLSGLSPVTREIKFYLPDLENKNLQTHIYTLDMYLSDDMAYLAMEKLTELLSLGDTRLLSVTLNSGLLTVDLSEEILFYPSLNKTYSELILYSIINTMADLSDVSLVRINIEGESVEYFGGIAAGQPFTPNAKLVGNKVITH